jgi:hypothetical protein
MNRVYGAVVSVALIAATLSPLARDPEDDGYPLSTYPMFAWKRPTKLTMSYAIGETSDGKRHYLAPRILGSGEVLQARAIVERAVRSGGAELAKFCEKVAKNVAELDRFDDVTRIRILSGTHDSIDFLVRGQLAPETERGKCEVKR